MRQPQWPRSRYWLCHFLNNRHMRVRIDWQAPAALDAAHAQPVADWLTWTGEINHASRNRMLAWATGECSGDPAYIQSLRLFVKEEHWHAAMSQRFMKARQLSGRSGGWNRAVARGLMRPLGLRFELSILLLSEIAVLTMSRLILEQAKDITLRGLLTQSVHDHECHVAFHSERLTAEFADFNFLRRNLRRWRLRGMFAALVAAMTVRHRRLLSALHCSKARFTRECWHTFAAVLERMVPYRREQLLSTLLHQEQEPFEKAGLP